MRVSRPAGKKPKKDLAKAIARASVSGKTNLPESSSGAYQGSEKILCRFLGPALPGQREGYGGKKRQPMGDVIFCLCDWTKRRGGDAEGLCRRKAALSLTLCRPKPVRGKKERNSEKRASTGIDGRRPPMGGSPPQIRSKTSGTGRNESGKRKKVTGNLAPRSRNVSQKTG